MEKSRSDDVLSEVERGKKRKKLRSGSSLYRIV